MWRAAVANPRQLPKAHDEPALRALATLLSRILPVMMGGVATILAYGAFAADARKPSALPLVEQNVLMVRLADGRLLGGYLRADHGVQQVAARYSPDNGATWSEAEVLLILTPTPGKWIGLQMLADSEGELHVFLLNDAKGDVSEAERAPDVLIGAPANRRLDIWHTRSALGRKHWPVPRMIWKGYTGALNSVIQMDSGRILLPFSYGTPRSWRKRGDGPDAFTLMGPYNCTVIYSDDFGQTWHSADALKCPAADIVSSYGAVEPVVIQLKDGRVWMLIRTQLGRFWESLSEDGATWSPPQPTGILSSDSPAGLVRLNDGRIVLLWNNCLRFPYAYGGRHVLHAAISDDEGKTWRGYREVAKDPKVAQPPPTGGDFGTGYPYPVLGSSGKVIYCTGQGGGRMMLKVLDPRWLLETSHSADFVNAREDWSVFGTKGAQFIRHPDRPEAGALRIAPNDPDWSASAVWNFPAGLSGSLRMKMRIGPRFGGALIGLTDHFSTPFDLEDRFHNVLNLDVAADGGLLDAALAPGAWHELRVDWSVPAGAATISVDGEQAGALPLLRQTAGICYLRLRALGQSGDAGGFIIASVDVDVTPED